MRNICTVEGCGSNVKGRGLCYGHYWRWRAHGDAFDRSPIRRLQKWTSDTCYLEGCGAPRRTMGLCANHYSRLQREGPDFDKSPIAEVIGIGAEIIARALADATPDKCIEWPLVRRKRGYGMTTVKGKTVATHRLVCTLAHGQPPTPKHMACHSCDNPPCINKFHLRWDLSQGNIDDRTKRGRGLQGETHHKAKLTEPQVREIKRRLDAGEPTQRLADEYGVTNGSIWFIAKGKNWRHVA